ncbi:L-hydantoinase [bioreactor metagenome]|uniref:L-hydantoinase n=2 Tax=root TaxID=1 RepID=A0A098B6Z8_DESHA|nr:amidohydrolase family protein [Desulfitobacterium hafniense]MEA5023377.1 amidohydrolase family protein [Desulfitobacterium hafniense]CDX04604.1 L-hydantoinase [Desulfitobacterium hafniense]
MNLDRALTNGTVVTPFGRFKGSIGIREGKIACITENTAELRAGEIIDAGGKFIIPGAIDTHIHFQDPGRIYREDFEHATAACACGGITTGMAMPTTNLVDVEGYKFNTQTYEGRGYIDYALHGAGRPSNVDQVEDLWTQTGITAIKMFMTYEERVDDATLWEILETLSRHDGLSIIHAENETLIKLFERRLQKQGRKDPMAHNESRPELVEIEAIRRVAYLVEQTNSKAVIAHVSSAAGLEEIKKAQQRGVRIWAESCPHFFTFVREDTEEQGPFLAFTPVMRGEDNRLKMWELLEKGYIDVIGSDHCPAEKWEKEVALDDIWKTHYGIPGLEVYLPSLLDGVNKGLVSLEKVVAATSYNAARIYGLYPRKGVVQPGADADLVVLDMDLEKKFTEADLKSKCPWSPYFGRIFKGWPILTLVRGEVVAKDGNVIGKLGHGKLVIRNK